jgi:hypothetical protein
MGELQSDRPARRVAEYVRVVDAELTQHLRRVGSLARHVHRVVLPTTVAAPLVGNDPELPGRDQALGKRDEEVL